VVEAPRYNHQVEGRATTVSSVQHPHIVSDLMRTEPKTVGRNDRLIEADRLMEMERIRHLPVVDDDGKLAGIVSQRDVLFNALVRALGFGTKAKDHTLESLRAKDVMVDQVVTTTPDARLSRAASLMSQMKVGCLPVLDGDRLVGILTESDVVRAFAELEGSPPSSS